MKRIFIIPIIALFLITFSGCSAISPTTDAIEGKYVISNTPISAYNYIDEMYFYNDGNVFLHYSNENTVHYSYSYSNKSHTIGLYTNVTTYGITATISNDTQTITIENYDYILQE